MTRRVGRSGLIVMATAALAAGPPLLGATAAQAAPSHDASATELHRVTLVTGDRVAVRTVGGKQTATVEHAGGGFLTQSIGDDLYVIPSRALPYLGRSLDRELFDVSALIRDGFADRSTAKIPVQLSFVDKPVTVPGIEGGEVVDAPAFGAALAAQPRESATLFGGVSSIRLAAPGAQPQATPRFPMHTVKIHAVGADGKPATAGMVVVNTDDSRKYGGFPVATGGEARISVPDGHYAIAAMVEEADAAGGPKAVRATLTEFTVTGADAEAAVDARTATAPVTFSTPRPANLVDGFLNVWRGDAAGQGLYGTGYFYAAGVAAYVTPVPVAPTGKLHLSVGGFWESPAAAVRDPYSYDVKFDNDGVIPANQHYVISPNRLETLRERYFSDTPARQGATSRIIILPYEGFAFGFFHPMIAPVNRTEYIATGAGAMTTDAYIADRASFSGFTVGGLDLYAPRTSASVDWLHGPLAPGLRKPSGVPPFLCDACRMDDTADLYLAPTLDSAGHIVYPDFPGPDVVSEAHYRLTSGSTVLADATQTSGATVTLPPGRARYLLTYDLTRKAPWFHQSTVSHSEWTFTSQHSGSQTVPADFVCGSDGKTPNCSPLSLVTADYRLDTTPEGTIGAGPARLTVAFGHSPGAANLPIRRAGVEVSFDGGTTWQSTCLDDLGHGRFRASWTNPGSAKPVDVALRVAASDVAGTSFSQTVTAAYTVPATPQS